MNDRELLELAAKAAGVQMSSHDLQRLSLGVPAENWNPLTNDGDALRLSVDMGFEDILYCRLDLDECHGNKYAATRRAIVRAAAEIGKAMP